MEIKTIYDKNLNKEETIKDLKKIYKVVEKNIEISEEIIEILKNSKITKTKKYCEIGELQKLVEKMSKIDDMFYKYISFFTILAFNNPSNENLIKKENNTENSINKFYSYHDLSNKISKYINNLYIFLENKKNSEKIKIEEKKIYEFSTKIINILIVEKIILERNIWIEGKTYKILLIEKLKNEYIAEIYSTKFKIISIKTVKYLCNNTFYSINELSKINYRSNKRFILKEESEVIEKLLNYSVMIDKDLLKENLNIYCSENKIEIQNIEHEYGNLIKNLKKILEEEDSTAYKEICKIISKYQKALTFKKILEDEREEVIYYMPFLFDFRGRIYKMSGLSPTFLKEIRYCLYLGYYNEKEIKCQKLNEIDKIILKYENLIDESEYFKKFKNETIKIKISIIWILISIGEIYKNEIGEEVKIEDFIKKSIKKIEHKETDNSLDYEKKMKMDYYTKIIKEIENKIYKKRLISKDATASVFQHLIKILGPKDNNSLKYCNMDSSDTWYDTYSIIINKWKKENENAIKKIKNEKNIFNRKTLKKVLMTENYGCGINTAWKYFKKEINLIENDNEIYETFTNFYKYISKECILTKENSYMIIDYFNKLEEKKIETSDKSIIDFTYKKIIKKQIDTTYKNKRFTTTINKISEKIDKEKFIISIRANYVHSQDASLVREVIKRCKIIAIHDCFMIDYLHISKLIKIINKCMNINFHSIGVNIDKKIFSIFIVI